MSQENKEELSVEIAPYKKLNVNQVNIGSDLVSDSTKRAAKIKYVKKHGIAAKLHMRAMSISKSPPISSVPTFPAIPMPMTMRSFEGFTIRS